jgi:hypothetical protein
VTLNHVSSEPIKKHEKSFYTIAVLDYGKGQYFKFPTHDIKVVCLPWTLAGILLDVLDVLDVGEDCFRLKVSLKHFEHIPSDEGLP